LVSVTIYLPKYPQKKSLEKFQKIADKFHSKIRKLHFDICQMQHVNVMYIKETEK